MAKSNSLGSDITFIKEFEELRIKQKLLIEALKKKESSKEDDLLEEVNTKLEFLVKLFKDAEEDNTHDEHIEDNFKKIFERLDEIETNINDRLLQLEKSHMELKESHEDLKDSHEELKESHEELKEVHDELPAKMGVQTSKPLNASNTKLELSDNKQSQVPPPPTDISASQIPPKPDIVAPSEKRDAIDNLPPSPKKGDTLGSPSAMPPKPDFDGSEEEKKKEKKKWF